MTTQIMRASMLLIFLLGSFGAALELLLLGHTEEATQFVPLILLGVAGLILAWTAITKSKASVRVFRACMMVFILAGVAGIVLHFRANLVSELRDAPDLSGLQLYWDALTGKRPALAPGSMSMLGLIGRLWTFRHPILLGERGYGADLKPEGNVASSASQR